MATVTSRAAAATTTGATSYATASFTPAANDLLVAMVTVTGAVNVGSMTDSQNLGWFLAGRALKAASVDTILVFVAETLAAASSMTATFSCSPTTATGAVVHVASVSGMTLTGAAAVLQVTEAINQAISTPAMSFVNNANTNNVTLGVIANATNPAAITAPTNWTQGNATGYATPTTGAEWWFRTSGFASTTITWGGTSTTAWGGIIIELDTSVTSPTGLVQGKSVVSGAAVASQAISFNKNVTVGNTIVVGTNDNNGALNSISTIADGLGNIYTRATSSSESSFVDGELWTAPVTTGGACTITVTPTGSVDVGVAIAEYSGLNSTPVDKVAGSNAITGTALSSGATAATTNANDVVIGLGAGNGTVTTRLAAGAGYGHRIADVNGTTGLVVALEDKVVVATGAQTATETQSASGHWVMLVAALKIGGGSTKTTTETGVSRINKAVTKTETGLSNVQKPYSRDDVGALGTTNADLTTYYTSTDRTNVATPDGVYVDENASAGTFVLHEYKDHFSSNTAIPQGCWIGKSTMAPTSATVNLQIYNVNSSTWETIASNSSAAASARFILNGSPAKSASNYYDGANDVAWRVEQSV